MLQGRSLFAIWLIIVSKTLYRHCESVNSSHYLNQIKSSFLESNNVDQDTPATVTTGETVDVVTNKGELSDKTEDSHKVEGGAEVDSPTAHKDDAAHSEGGHEGGTDPKAQEGHASHAEGTDDKAEGQPAAAASSSETKEADVHAHGTEASTDGRAAHEAVTTDEHEDHGHDHHGDDDHDDDHDSTEVNNLSLPEGAAAPTSVTPEAHNEDKKESATEAAAPSKKPEHGGAEAPAKEEAHPGASETTPAPDNKDHSNEREQETKENDQALNPVEDNAVTQSAPEGQAATESGQHSEATPTDKGQEQKAEEQEAETCVKAAGDKCNHGEADRETGGSSEPQTSTFTPVVTPHVQTGTAQTAAVVTATVESQDHQTAPNALQQAVQQPQTPTDLNNLTDEEKEAVRKFYTKASADCSVDCSHSCKSRLGGASQCVMSTYSTVSCSTFQDAKNLTCPEGHTPCAQPNVTQLKSYTLKNGTEEVGALEVDGSNFNKCMAMGVAEKNANCDKEHLVANLLFTSTVLNLDYKIEVESDKLTFSNLKMNPGEYKVFVFQRHEGDVQGTNITEFFKKLMEFLNPTHQHEQTKPRTVFVLEIGTLKVSE